jgi:hypothetical protein
MAPCPSSGRPGGIQAIIQDLRSDDRFRSIFLCYEKTPDAFWGSVKRAREIFHDKATWTTLIEGAMARDFS